ncbi:CopD family protein [Sinimarinibacterium sp. CAU 1509]|uniref:CopD family protein n=1 Tax=Sinimarinibacterium sp. CAU 1509 TaxID=2562283 RepID=UPI0010AB8B86|nr:CopD family protein [Sinimarinibacterium sp. CAU 1509]TJY64856.1 CopD family protein [Sinimarinibacterium sp. CAU 1509]
MLWLKAVHIIFVVAWFAGLFYMPRLFVYHTQALASPSMTDAEHARFCVMERKLYGITTIGMIGTWAFGIATLLSADTNYAKALYWGMGWLHVKIALVLALSGYHGWLKVTARRFAAHANTRSERYYRIVNEVPALILIAVVLLVVTKPF